MSRRCRRRSLSSHSDKHWPAGLGCPSPRHWVVDSAALAKSAALGGRVRGICRDRSISQVCRFDLVCGTWWRDAGSSSYCLCFLSCRACAAASHFRARAPRGSNLKRLARLLRPRGKRGGVGVRAGAASANWEQSSLTRRNSPCPMRSNVWAWTGPGARGIGGRGSEAMQSS